METSSTDGQITYIAPDLTALLHVVLESLIHSTNDRSGQTWIIGFSAEVTSQEALVPAVVEDIRHTARERGARVLGWDVSGVQETDEGIRAWGTIELVDRRGEGAELPELVSVTIHRTEDGHWHMTAQRVSKDTT